jgi:hypothetical protein
MRGWAQLTQVSQMRVDRPVSALCSKAMLHRKASLSRCQLALAKLMDA